ncbi:MAG: hypothetical protein NC038_03835 [Paludibacter sp.]|nr:hypothetical protein [Bacteroidales bacterium]MCM1069209.1 hypothetical protein [Prevotella sp.]MCM1354114.1 hypothetical protein [Bacteroides sp.]MCM1442913.1 hypothetical protein [Muribaculum sp.]MCM1481764.1 hypothetical protein [Paludibacter sp.]
MKKITFTLLLLIYTIGIFAAQTTYTFTSKAWTSKIETITTDGKTDGWTSIKDAYSYQNGYDTPQGITGRGMQVTSKASGAEGISIVSFNNIRSLRINYCTNNKAGAGTLVIWIGENDSVVTAITSPTSNGSINRDIEISLPQPQTGHIRFKINCTTNSLYINSINIKADNASPSVAGITRDVFRIVTDASTLKDGDKVIVGVVDNNINYVMGVFDEQNSRNNIHALQGVYSNDRSSVNEIAAAVYTLSVRHNEETNEPFYTFMDYTGWYLVADGGNPNNGNNNYLTAWDTIASSNFGLYGGWDINISNGGEATVKSLGRSRSNLLQFNPNGTKPIFACYQDMSQTAVALYRREEAPDEGEPYIASGIVNFGNVILESDKATGSKTIDINAVNLTDDICATLLHGDIFSLSTTQIDRDGDPLTISYSAATAGHYTDTIVLSSGTAKTEIPVLITLQQRINIAKACQLEDLSTCYLTPVTVTKKYDKYIFVQDTTGSMLLFDGANQYGKGIGNGDVLTNVSGKYKNYYGNPSLTLTEAFDSKNCGTCQPTEQTETLRERDACRYIRICNTQFNANGACLVGENYVDTYDLFDYNPAIDTEVRYNMDAIVYNYNGMVLCPVKIEEQKESGITAPSNTGSIYLQDGILHNPNSLLINIYNSTGMLLHTTRTDTDMSNRNTGIYIIQTDNNTQKIVL